MNKNTEISLLYLLQDLEHLEHTHRDKLSGGLNVFEAAGLVRQEIRHSNILAFLINPNEPHGLGDLVLKQIINSACEGSECQERPNPLAAAMGDFDDALVRREEMHIDLLIWSPQNKIVLVIENKVDAGQGNGQLRGYRERICKDARFTNYHKLFVYLTVSGEEPDDKGWWTPMDYRVITKLIEVALEKRYKLLDESSKVFVTHYIDLLKRCVMEEIDPELKNACLQLYEKHKQVLKIVFENIKKPVNDVIQTFLEKHQKEVVMLASSGNRLAFLPQCLISAIPEVKGTEWFGGCKRPIVFWFTLQEDKIGLIAEVGPMDDQEIRTRIISTVCKSLGKKPRQGGTGGTFTRIWTKYENRTEEMSSDGINQLMTGLYTQLINDGVIDAFESAANEAWN